MALRFSQIFFGMFFWMPGRSRGLVGEEALKTLETEKEVHEEEMQKIEEVIKAQGEELENER